MASKNKQKKEYNYQRLIIKEHFDEAISAFVRAGNL
jgi:hypothetical protein